MNKIRIPYEQARDGNRTLWDEITPVHLRSYGVERFLSGEPWLPNEIIEEVGEVRGLRLLHLQCHFGLDTLAWARLGAEVVGVDFSPAAIEAARELSIKADLPASFICTDIYDLPQHLQGEFDVVFTSIGVLCWLKDLTAWAKIITQYLKPGGIFYLMEGHPLLDTFGDETPWKFALPYFHNDIPYVWDAEDPDYMDPTYLTKSPSYEWQWAVSDIINAVAGAGLRIELFNEFDATSMALFPEMKAREDGLFSFPDMPVPLPTFFSLRARKEG